MAMALGPRPTGIGVCPFASMRMTSFASGSTIHWLPKPCAVATGGALGSASVVSFPVFRSIRGAARTRGLPAIGRQGEIASDSGVPGDHGRHARDERRVVERWHRSV